MLPTEDLSQPHDDVAEQVVLGCMMESKQAIVRVQSIIRSVEDFYRGDHRLIYAAVQRLVAAGEPIDQVTVFSELEREGKFMGGMAFLEHCIAEVPTTHHATRYATIVAEAALLRRLMDLGMMAHREARAYPEDARDLLNTIRRELAQIEQNMVGEERGAALVRDTADELARRLEAAMEAQPHVSAARTGIFELDKRMGGFAGETLVVVRGTEKAGKSMFGLQALLASARAFAEEGQGRCALGYVLEGADIWKERAIAWLGEFNSWIFTPMSTPFEHERAAYNRALAIWRTLPLFVTSTLYDLDDILVDIRRVNMSHPVGLVLIDYAQLIQGGAGGSPVERNEDKANRLAALASELRFPIIVPSQITQGDGGRHAKWARAWDEAGSLIFDVERGAPGEKRREHWQASTEGRLRLHGSRRSAPFGVYEITFNLATGRITDAPQRLEEHE